MNPAIRISQPMATPQTASLSVPLWIPFALVAVYLFAGLGSYGLLDDNEGLYAEVAREMLQGGSYLIPQLDGVPYIEKPPLFYYLLAASFRLFGETEVAARLVPVSASLICLLGLLWFANKLDRPQAGRLAILILVSGFGYVAMSRVVMPDMLLTALFNVALFSFYLAERDRNPALLRASYAFLALALLTKGLVALALYGLIVGGFLLMHARGRRADTVKFLCEPWAIALFLALAVPWHVLAALNHPQFAWFYFINEHVLRFLGLREPKDYYSGSVLYHLPRLLLFLFPWPAYLLLKFYKLKSPPAEDDQALRTFLWIAWLAPLAFFSLSSAKANYYMILAMPALAILIALRIEALIAEGRHRLLAIPIAVMLLGLAILGIRYWLTTHDYLRQPVSPNVTAKSVAIAAFVVIAVTGFALSWAGQRLAGLVTVALMLAPAEGYVLYAVSHQEAFYSSRALAQSIRSSCAHCRVFLYRDFERMSSLPFYLHSQVGIIDSASNDLRFGQHQSHDAALFVSSATFVRDHGDEPVAVVVHGKRMKEFRGTGLYEQLKPADKVGRVRVFVN